MNDPRRHELFSFLQSVSEELAAEYRRIQARATEDPGTAGDEGEENWAAILRQWLPPAYRVVTHGRLLSHNGQASSQVDVLVLSPSYPSWLVNKKLYLAAGVVAVFECKLTLTAAHIRDAIATAASIADLTPGEIGSPFRELCGPIVCGLLAHSHTWKSDGSLPIHNVSAAMHKADRQFVTHPRQTLDMLCVSDLATWVSTRHPYWEPEALRSNTPVGRAFLSHIPDTSIPLLTTPHGLITERVGNPFTPIGSVLCWLLRKLAWRDPTLRALADYFDMVGAAGPGAGEMRWWPLEVYSPDVKRHLEEEAGNQVPTTSTHARWSEWGPTIG